MIWVLATHGASTKLRATPFTETTIAGVHSVVYRPGVEPLPCDGADGSECLRGEFDRGLHRVSGLLYTYHGSAAEELLMLSDDLDLIVRYRASGELRKRTFQRAVFLGDALVAFANRNSGVSMLTGVPFRLQVPEGDTLEDAVSDALDA